MLDLFGPIVLLDVAVLELSLLCLHDGMLLLQHVVPVVHEALLFELVLFFHLCLHLPLLDLLDQVALQSIVVELALEGFVLQRVADFQILPLLGDLDHLRYELIFPGFSLRVVHELARGVLTGDGVLARDAVFHPLHVVVLVLHERRNGRAQVLDQLATVVIILDQVLLVFVKPIGVRPVAQVLVVFNLYRGDAVRVGKGDF